MRGTLGKVLGGLAAVLLLLAGGLGATVQAKWDRTFDVEAPALAASTDPEIIAHGRYLAYGPAHCSYCHNPTDRMAELEAGAELPLVGGAEFDLPIGRIRSPNITPDAETGIGTYSDAQLARMLRYNVRHDGQAALPIMEFQQLSDEDVVAIISFLRSQEPVRSRVAPSEYNFLGKALKAFALAPAIPGSAPPRMSPAADGSVARGEYLATAVANCAGCHTKRDMRTGAYTAPRFSGGLEMEMDGDPTQVFVSPNLTPDPRTGFLAGWTEDQFVQRMRAGKRFDKSHMPWAAYAKMTDDDLRAIFRFLASLEPVENETGPTLRKKG
jgi:mono/diheme cytochrome c family protein